MHQYGVREIEKLLRLPRSTIRAFITAGFVSPTRGPRKTLRFSFQDLIMLRTAQALADANVPAKRISRSLKELRHQLPETMPLSGISIGAVGNRVVVRDGAGQRQAESGQYLLGFEGNPEAGSLCVIDLRQVAEPATGEKDWFDEAVTQEHENAEAALQSYQRAVADDPVRLDARINMGRLLHETGQLAKAEKSYRDALESCGSDPILLFNLGVLLEDMDRKPEAMEMYAAALRIDPDLADCHYNLALLYEKLNKPKEAIRHMSRYRRLTGTPAE